MSHHIWAEMSGWLIVLVSDLLTATKAVRSTQIPDINCINCMDIRSAHFPKINGLRSLCPFIDLQGFVAKKKFVCITQSPR